MSIHTLVSLPPRPPTPPRESSHDPMGDVPLKPTLVRPPADPKLSLQTPPNGVHSPHSTTHSNGSSRRSGKNVAFASLTEYKDAPAYGVENRTSPPSGPLIPSARASKPQKGILKPFSSPNPLELSFNTANGAVSRLSLVDMLESTLRQLAGDDRADKVDAYGTLTGALKASNNLPDRVALQDRMPRFMEFIQRDITTTPLDTPLANHALTFLLTIFHFSGVSSSLSNDFGIFIIDHCIRSFGDSTVTKEVTRHLLHVVAQQNFPPRVMTVDRTTRLLTALHNIENHVTGKSIIHSRIMIYRRLMKQCKPAMLAHTGWLRDLITDTISTTKDIRTVAIAFGLEASAAIGKDRQVSKKLAELFRSPEDEKTAQDNQPAENKREYIDLYIERLKTMLRSRQDPSSVPRIWSVILLLLRGIQLDKWQSLNPWLRIIQQCFNTSDMHTRREANYAWNRFVYVLYLEEASFSKLLSSTLCSPVCSQWRRKAVPAKNDDEFQSVIFGSACNLFYYMFKPGVSHAQLDKYWDKGFKQIMQQLCAPDQPDERYDQAICIFTNLFDATTRRQWTEDRVMQNPTADASELPPLDPRWLRRNAARVFQLVQPVLERKFSELSNASSATAKMWQSLIASVSSAASKEIKVSFETTEFISQVFTSLSSLWRRGVSPVVLSQDAESQRRTFLASTREFVTAVVSAFGVLPFTEKQLCSREDVFTPVTTPSHRLSKTSGTVLTPLHHLFAILSSTPEGVEDDDAFAEFFEAVFRPFFRTRNPKASTELAQEMINLIPMDTVCPYGPWIMAADTVKTALAQGRSRQKSSLGLSKSHEVAVGPEYRDVCKILERGFKSTPNLPWDHWFALFGAFENHVGEETGDAGRALAVVEPLAKTVLDHVASSEGLATQTVNAASALLIISKQPVDRQAVDTARKRLWGTTIAKSPTFDPFDNLYKLSNFLMEHLYKNLDSPKAADLPTTAFMEDLDEFLGGCNKSLAMRTISILQDGLVFWIKDDESRLSSRQAAETASAAKQVWDRICQIVNEESSATINLESVERLFCAAFQSKHRHVVNSMAILWNRIFSDAEEVSYPDELKATLIAIRPVVDIVLPGVEESSQESAAAAQHAFIGSQDDMDVLNVSPVKSSRSERLRLVSSGSSLAPTPISLQSDDNKTRALSAGNQKQTKPKLRHDDSQLQFEPIESASPGEEESQVLTDRQMEVRERQREQDALYNIRSSTPVHEDEPEAGNDETPSSPQLPEPSKETPKKLTPAVRTTYDYVNSTPTPRRGQMLPLVHDVEMSDPPSSPPEFSQVRRYPLVPEIGSRSGDESVNWEYTSSPVSGSPLPSRVPPRREDEKDKERSRESADPKMVEDDAEDDADDVAVADSFAIEVVPSSAPTENKPEESDKAPEREDPNSTPTRRQTRQSTRASSQSAPSTPQQGADSPRSANEEFVDALTSPRAASAKKGQKPPPTSLRQSGETSFALSEDAEQGMIRLAEEMEAKYKQTRPKRSPKARKGKTKETKGPVLDCITVAGDDEEASEEEAEEEKTPKRRSERVIPSTPHVETPSERGSKKSTSGGRKRKRGSGSRQYDTRPKRQRSETRADDGGSATSSPSLRRRKRMQSQEEEEVHSQVISEHMAASSQSRLSPELGEETNLSQDVEMGDAPKTGKSSSRKTRSSLSESSDSYSRKKPAHKIERHLKKALERVQTASISREEMYRIEDLFVDFKRELYEAERRGRQE